MVKVINFVMHIYYTQKDEHKTANNLHFLGTFNLADGRRQEHKHSLTDWGRMSDRASGRAWAHAHKAIINVTN